MYTTGATGVRVASICTLNTSFTPLGRVALYPVPTSKLDVNLQYIIYIYFW